MLRDAGGRQFFEMNVGNQSFNAATMRERIVQMAYSGQSVHVACAFSIVEILAVLYREHLRFPEGGGNHPLRDYLVLSKGHGALALYVCLYEKGWVAAEDLANYFKDGTRLRGLSEIGIPGVEVTSGSLGHGLSVGVGLALAAKRRGTGQACYAVIGDGEANEGSIWEAIQFAAHFNIDNLTVIIDMNGFQAMGATEDVMRPGDMAAKLAAFGLDVAELDGHDETALNETFRAMKERKNGRPKGIVAHTIKGKGVSFMENNNIWHYTRLSDKTYEAAMGELRAKTNG